MSRFDFREAVRLNSQDEPFYALLMAAILRADAWNALRLKEAFPDVWAELETRYHAPGGLLPGEEDFPPPTPLQVGQYRAEARP